MLFERLLGDLYAGCK
jgi:hypothetical protein